MEIQNLNDVETEIKNLNGLKKHDRKKAITEISFEFYKLLKKFGYLTIEKKFLNSFFDADAPRTRQRVSKEILNELIKKNLIELDTKNKSSIRFELKPLETYDKESYNLMMHGNGYKKFFYKYVYDEFLGLPKKVLLGSFKMTEELNKDFLKNSDVVETKSFRLRKNQRVLSSNSLSIARSRKNYKVKVYRIL